MGVAVKALTWSADMNAIEFKSFIEDVKTSVKALRNDYPNLELYPVLCASKGQCSLKDDFLSIFTEIPSFFEDNLSYEELQKLLELKKTKSKTNYKDQINIAVEGLENSTNSRVELRYENLKYDEIRALKSHPLVNQPEDMMRDAYIRVVLTNIVRKKES